MWSVEKRPPCQKQTNKTNSELNISHKNQHRQILLWANLSFLGCSNVPSNLLNNFLPIFVSVFVVHVHACVRVSVCVCQYTHVQECPILTSVSCFPAASPCQRHVGGGAQFVIYNVRSAETMSRHMREDNGVCVCACACACVCACVCVIEGHG